ncbi:MAG: hypothetical protein ABJA37_04145 [Ferruginibacter sp.]
MKNLIAILVVLCPWAYASAQNNINNNGGSTPASNPTLQSATSNSNNSNSGVNPQGNPGTILNSNSNSSSGGFQTPTPVLEPGVKLNSGGNNAILPATIDHPNNRPKVRVDSSPQPLEKNLNKNPSSIPTPATRDKNAHIDSMIRAIDRRHAENKKPAKVSIKTSVKKVKNNN